MTSSHESIRAGQLCALRDDGPTFLFEAYDASSTMLAELWPSTLAVVLYANEHDRVALAMAEGMVGWIVKSRLVSR